MATMMRRGIFLLGLVLAGPAVAQTDPGYRMVTPWQQTPLPWHGTRAAPVPAPAPQATPPDLSATVQRLRQGRTAREQEEMRNALIANALRRRDR